MTYTEDREVFERDLFKPPYLARMLERGGQYTGRLDRPDREFILARALDEFWELRGHIKTSNDVLRVWDLALRHAALTRPKWKVWWSWATAKWVKGTRLGKE